MKGEIQGGGVETPSELFIFTILNLLTDIKIKYNENIVGYIISHKNNLNMQIFCAKMCYLNFFALPPPPPSPGPPPLALARKCSWLHYFSLGDRRCE